MAKLGNKVRRRNNKLPEGLASSITVCINRHFSQSGYCCLLLQIRANQRHFLYCLFFSFYILLRLFIMSSFQASAFAFLFPGSPMVNSILATAYISIFPNLLLYFVPPDIDTGSLNTLVSFAVGNNIVIRG